MNSEKTEVFFAKNGENGIFTLKIDELNEIKLVLLDIEFPGQRMEGSQIFEEIKSLRPDLPIVILTKHDSYTEFEEFQERGASDYIVKNTLERKTKKLTNWLKESLSDPQNTKYTLCLNPVTNRICYMDIIDNKSGNSMLKRRKKLTIPVKKIIIDCSRSPNRSAKYPEVHAEGYLKGQVKELEPYDRTEIQKEVHKFNKSIKDSSEGRVFPILRGKGIYGASAFELIIGKVKFVQSL